MSRTFPLVEVVIVGVGFAAAVAAGVYGYRTVGLYGDGPYARGYHRETDPQTGESVLVHEVETSKGRIRRVLDVGMRVREMGIDADLDGEIESSTVRESTGAESSRVALDQNNNGRADTFGYWEAGRVRRIELDLDEDGKIERWEYYQADGKRLEKIGTSSQQDGIEDRWSFPDASGLLLKEEFDTDRDGHVDKRDLYSPSPQAPDGRVLATVELGVDQAGVPERRLHYAIDGSFSRAEVVRPPAGKSP